MLKIENADVYGWEAAIRGARNPMNSWDKSDSVFFDNDDGCTCAIGQGVETSLIELGPNDHKLLRNLTNAGPDHGKFMRMITVSLDITAPLYWWKEFDTYKVGTVANSCSTMHKIHAKEFTLEDFSYEHLVGLHTAGFAETMMCDHDDVNDRDHWYSPQYILENFIIKALNVNRDNFNKATHALKNRDLTDAERKHIQAQQKCYWWQMIQLLPTSYNQRRTVLLNYQVLKSMYHARKNHKLDEWHTFCDWIRGLPYSELITNEG